MPNDSIAPAHQMNGWEKRDVAESTLKSGDALTANNVLNTVQDQKLFMDLLAGKADQDSLPGLQITSDNAGHVHQIKTDKMTISDASGHLTAEANSHTMGQYIHAKWDNLTKFAGGVSESVKDYAGSTELGDALKKSGTPQSLLNQNIDAHIKQAGG